MRGVALDDSVPRLSEHGSQFRTLAVEHVYLRPPGEAGLGNDPVEGGDQDVVVDAGGVGVQADLQCYYYYQALISQ